MRYLINAAIVVRIIQMLLYPPAAHSLGMAVLTVGWIIFNVARLIERNRDGNE